MPHAPRPLAIEQDLGDGVCDGLGALRVNEQSCLAFDDGIKGAADVACYDRQSLRTSLDVDDAKPFPSTVGFYAAWHREYGCIMEDRVAFLIV